MPDDDKQLQEAGELVAAAIARLDARGLIDHDGEDGAATLSVEGLTTLHDAVVLFTLNTSGPDLPDNVRLAHDAGAIFGQALNVLMFAGDAQPEQLAKAKRQAIGAIKRAAWEHSY